MESHLLQMRGLKHDTLTTWAEHYVASFTDAWIETEEMRHQYRRPKGRIFYRCVD